VYRRWWSVLNSDLPAEWLVDERAEVIAALERLRDREGELMAQADAEGDVAEFEHRRQVYEALATVLPEEWR
jgi:hypothetical protein